MGVLKIDRTGDEFRAMARQCYQRSHDSFERSDTDGCVSQWANDTLARQYELAATVADNGGYDEFPAIFDLNGAIVPAKIVDTRYGAKWLVTERWSDNGEKCEGDAVAWLPLADHHWDGSDNHGEITKRSIKNLAKRGYRFGYVKLKAVIVGYGSGFQVAYRTIPAYGQRWDAAEIVDIL